MIVVVDCIFIFEFWLGEVNEDEDVCGGEDWISMDYDFVFGVILSIFGIGLDCLLDLDLLGLLFGFILKIN